MPAKKTPGQKVQVNQPPEIVQKKLRGMVKSSALLTTSHGFTRKDIVSILFSAHNACSCDKKTEKMIWVKVPGNGFQCKCVPKDDE